MVSCCDMSCLKSQPPSRLIITLILHQLLVAMFSNYLCLTFMKQISFSLSLSSLSLSPISLSNLILSHPLSLSPLTSSPISSSSLYLFNLILSLSLSLNLILSHQGLWEQNACNKYSAFLNMERIHLINFDWILFIRGISQWNISSLEILMLSFFNSWDVLVEVILYHRQSYFKVKCSCL